MQNLMKTNNLTMISKWFPSKHGGIGGMKEVERNLAKVDCVIEVHDARAPLSGRNAKFLERLRVARPHLLVLNKSDMIPKRTIAPLVKHIVDTESKSSSPLHMDPVFVSAIRDFRVKKIVPRCTKLIEGFFRDNIDFAKIQHTIMIVGVPNVGKSSIINAIRERYTGLKNEATPIGSKPGVTRHVLQTIRISESPKIYLVDTPGVLEANPVAYENALRLALCGCAIDKEVGVQLMAAYLLQFMQSRGTHYNNNHGIYTYCNYMGLDLPTDDLRTLLTSCATMLSSKRKVRNIYDSTGGYSYKMDLDAAAAHFIFGFRRGIFGRILLDTEGLPAGMPCWEADGYTPASILP
ncbi:mitochondrial GTPase 1-like isoform X1 [Varroa jacobsoni]|uniref:CP-type G domain-containing protein n=1 Tax=Varroa destructor TaxID=109461 RepID=A0A7M7JTS4_VARDE|nr:mitochondrial GTPase 1-like isoform X2 [Varroa destructor]XP_022687073.1 mitochondrial GTPase 1-like isoform X1 [Varroa jacobsoni]